MEGHGRAWKGMEGRGDVLGQAVEGRGASWKAARCVARDPHLTKPEDPLGHAGIGTQGLRLCGALVDWVEVDGLGELLCCAADLRREAGDLWGWRGVVGGGETVGRRGEVSGEAG